MRHVLIIPIRIRLSRMWTRPVGCWPRRAVCLRDATLQSCSCQRCHRPTRHWPDRHTGQVTAAISIPDMLLSIFMSGCIRRWHFPGLSIPQLPDAAGGRVQRSATSLIVNQRKTVTSLRSLLRLPGFKSRSGVFSLLTSVAVKCRLPDIYQEFKCLPVL